MRPDADVSGCAAATTPQPHDSSRKRVAGLTDIYIYRERERETETERQRETERDRDRDRQTETETETGRQTERGGG